MNGGRITSDEKSTLGAYIVLIVVIALAAGGIYFFVLATKDTKAPIGFDPKRPIPTDVFRAWAERRGRALSADAAGPVPGPGTGISVSRRFD